MYSTSNRCFTIVMVLLLAACGSGTGPSIHVPDADEDVAPPTDQRRGVDICVPVCEARVCGDDGCGGSCGDCAFDRVCSDDGQCETVPCVNSKDCPDALVCDEENGVCAECVGDEDCPEGGVCNDAHHCTEEHPCQSDLDCKGFDQLCDKEIGLCVDCLDAKDCLEEEFCDTGTCLPDACAAGATGCDGQDATLCAIDGSGWTVTETCGEGWYCEAGACLEYACEAGASWCDADVFKACSDDGKALVEETDCAATGLFCTPEGCLETVCPSGQVYCQDDETLATCSEDGQELTTEPCDESHYCEEGACVPQVCEPDTEGCDGYVAYLCDSIGSGYVSSMDCGEWQMSCLDGACIPCTPDCEEKECGDDGCGGSCGICPGEICAFGICVECWDGNDVDWDGCNGDIIAEWQVNQTTGNNQSYPRNTALAGGGFALIWSSMGQDGDSKGVFGRVFGSTGQPLTDEFQVNTWTFSSQSTNGIDSRNDGGFVAVWESSNQDAANGSGVYAQRFGPLGEKIGPEVPVNTSTAGYQSNSNVTCTTDGRCLVVWDSAGVGIAEEIYGQWFDAQFEKSGVEFQVNYYNPEKQRNPAIAATSQGGVWVAWDGVGPGDDKGIFLRRLNEDGIPVDTEVKVNTFTDGFQGYPKLAVLGDGTFLVTWQGYGADGSDSGISMRLYSPEGDAVSGEVVVNETIESHQTSSSVAAISDDRFVVMWRSNDDVWRRIVNATGDFIGGEFQMNVFTPGIQANQRAATLGSGDFVVTWSSEDQDGSGYGVFAQLFNPAGEKIAPAP